jgi:Uma2 family endonuclease
MSNLMHELPRRHRITVEHFYRMAEAGLFAEDERVELIEGEIIDVPPMGHSHAGVVGYLVELLMSSLDSRAIIRSQLPLRLGQLSEPLPDIVVARAREDRYFGSHPTAEDAVVVIEVASTTLRFDRKVKVPMYARHAVPEVWVLDVSGAQIHLYRSPREGQYTSATTVPLASRMPLDAWDARSTCTRSPGFSPNRRAVSALLRLGPKAHTLSARVGIRELAVILANVLIHFVARLALVRPSP